MEALGAAEDTGGVVIGRMRWWQIDAAAQLERDLFGGTAWSAETFWSELARPETRWYVSATEDQGIGGQRLLGYAGLMVNDRQGDVQTVAVAPSARGRGLGARLLGDLLGEAARRRARSVLLEVDSANEPAIALYRRFGFERISVRRGYYAPQGGDAWVMRRPVPSTSGGSA